MIRALIMLCNNTKSGLSLCTTYTDKLYRCRESGRSFVTSIQLMMIFSCVCPFSKWPMFIHYDGFNWWLWVFFWMWMMMKKSVVYLSRWVCFVQVCVCVCVEVIQSSKVCIFGWQSGHNDDNCSVNPIILSLGTNSCVYLLYVSLCVWESKPL